MLVLVQVGDGEDDKWLRVLAIMRFILINKASMCHEQVDWQTGWFRNEKKIKLARV